MARIRDPQFTGAGSALPVALALPVAMVGVALARGGTDQACHLSLNHAMRGEAGHLAQQVSVGRPFQKSAMRHRVAGLSARSMLQYYQQTLEQCLLIVL